MPYDLPIRSTLPPTPETRGDWESMAYPAGEGVGAVRALLPAAEIIRAHDGPGIRHTHEEHPSTPFRMN